MGSCEYLKVAPEETKRTKKIRVGNVIFKKGNKVIQHNDPDLRSSDVVRIIFFPKRIINATYVFICLSEVIQFYSQ